MRAIRIVAPDDYPPALSGSPAERKLRDMGELSIYKSLPEQDSILIERIRDADVVIGIRGSACHFTASVLAQCEKLKHIAVWGVGVDHVDLEACRERDIRVSNTPSYCSHVVAEFALMLALTVAKRVLQNDRAVREGEWQQARRFFSMQLFGKVLGVIGAGPIAQQVMTLGKTFGMKVISWTLHPSEERAKALGIEFVPLDELMSRSDVISIHLPLTTQSRGLIGRHELSLMKSTAILVNTARGAIVDEKGLLDVLQTQRIYGVGLDVFAEEPLPRDHPFTKLENVILSPHKAAWTREADEAGLWMAAENIENWLRGKPTNVLV